MTGPVIRHRGEPVALVVAETLEAAIEGAEAVKVRYATEAFSAAMERPRRGCDGRSNSGRGQCRVQCDRQTDPAPANPHRRSALAAICQQQVTQNGERVTGPEFSGAGRPVVFLDRRRHLPVDTTWLRSAFATRFRDIVGIGLISYLLRWRMALAKEALKSGTARMEEHFRLAISRRARSAPPLHAPSAARRAA